MRKIIAITGLCCLIGSSVLAAEAYSKQKVHYTVAPSVSFRSAAATTTTGGIFQGDSEAVSASGNPSSGGGLTLSANFTPRANSQDVKMWVCATPLFKGVSPIRTGGAPNTNAIPLADQETKPAMISGAGFSPTPKAMPLTVTGTFSYDAYLWPRTCSAEGAADATTFSGATANTFANSVDVAVVWASGDAVLPTGIYGGYIQLYVATMPL